MSRIAITDGSGRWFNEASAERFDELSYHNGSNFISKATGEQFQHEALYITTTGRFILNSYSNWQGDSETYEVISKDSAAEWFSKQGYDEEDIPDFLIDECNLLEI
jgi:hypothetical protein